MQNTVEDLMTNQDNDMTAKPSGPAMPDAKNKGLEHDPVIPLEDEEPETDIYVEEWAEFGR